MFQDQNNLSDDQINILEKFVTNVSKNIFALKNLPEVIKGALFSRYSRSSLGLRELLLKDFILNEETAFTEIADLEKEKETESLALQKAQNFYDRILDGYGDDSIAELGGAHLAIENISMIAAKTIEDCRIGGSPLEKSTRYIYFDQKVNGEYLFYKEPVLMTSAYRDLYINTCRALFDAYTKLIPPLTEIIEKKFPQESHISKVAYRSALRAKVLDCLRGLLPASALTNLGLFGNGRYYENLIRKLSSENLAEMQDVGKEAYEELSKVIPSFIRRAETSNKSQQSYLRFVDQMRSELKILTENHQDQIEKDRKQGVRLIHFDPASLLKVAASLLFPYSSSSLKDLEEYLKKLPEEEVLRILDSAGLPRENRRHKSPRALENAYFTFEIVADFGIYRDLQRHRILTQQRQLLSCDYGYYIPYELLGTEWEKEYVQAMENAKKVYDRISQELPEEAQYVVPMAYNMRWYFTVNLRELQWICELRSSPAGHPNYRYIAQKMVELICLEFPAFERFFKFVDFEGYQLGRMNQEISRVEKNIEKQ